MEGTAHIVSLGDAVRSVNTWHVPAEHSVLTSLHTEVAYTELQGAVAVVTFASACVLLQ